MSREMTPHEHQAVQRVERAIKRLPESIGIYFNGDSATVIDCDEDGRMLRRGEGFDPDAILDGFDTPRCEAGGW